MELRLSAAGVGLWVLSGLVAGAGQIATEGGLLHSFLVVEVIGLALVVAIVFTLRARQGAVRLSGLIAAGLLGLFALATAVGMAAEIAGGSAPRWLPVDLALTSAMACVYLALAATALRRQTHRRRGDRGGL